ncbi:MAG: ABC transporter substrate-binding protein, partial [Acidobacteria bacterium]|nr:ABC transporter substrate-binding protein [Acidobacteriota bacterium]
MEFSRRQGLSFGLLALAGATLSACSTGAVGTASESTAAGATDSFPVTIKHAFGETVIKSAPSKVATISWVNADVVLALGVVPVGMPKDDWGANAQGSTPWKDEALKTAG